MLLEAKVDCLKATFPYQRLNYPEGELRLPMVPINVSYKGEPYSLYALVDSGATTSIFSPQVAAALKIDIPSGEKTSVTGMCGKKDCQMGYLHEVDIKIAGMKRAFTCPAIFLTTKTCDMNLLGRSVFFDRHIITFIEDYKIEIEEKPISAYSL